MPASTTLPIRTPADPLASESSQTPRPLRVAAPAIPTGKYLLPTKTKPVVPKKKHIYTHHEES